MKTIKPLGASGRDLLRVIVSEAQSRRIDPDDKKTMISYSLALGKLNQPKPWFRAGKRLQAIGLTELNEWTRDSQGRLPHVCGLIVNKKTGIPSVGFPQSHGIPLLPDWRPWWKKQANAALIFDWRPYIK